MVVIALLDAPDHRAVDARHLGELHLSQPLLLAEPKDGINKLFLRELLHQVLPINDAVSDNCW